jgi:uncharacterized radical SAM superfamily Fe-S cluster-containing enzyme
MKQQEDYLFLESTTSLCSECLEKVEAKIISKDNKVYIKKNCEKHGEQIELLEDSLEYHKSKQDYLKPGTKTPTQTKVSKGCPFDCGLCPNHEQHTCNGLIEVTQNCDLNCFNCYANSSTNNKHLDIKTIEKMLDFFRDIEGNKPEILHISGGEPTTHPEILKIIEIAKNKNLRYILLNTNGLRISKDEGFVKELSKFRGRFEIYLQFDSLNDDDYKLIRGKSLLAVKMKAIENLRKYKIPITLVVTIQKGINDKELHKIIKFAMETKGIRGVNFQPLAFFGRNPRDIDPKNRITLSGIIKNLEETVPELQKGDIIPLPCHLERVGVCYFFKKDNKFVPLTRHVKVKDSLSILDNTFAFDAEKILKEKKLEIAKKVISGCCSFDKNTLFELIPKNYLKMTDEEQMDYWDNNMFRISISSFVDKYNFDMKSLQKECVHVITPDLKRIPFSAYNLLHRKSYK